jgi:hypothetical protein
MAIVFLHHPGVHVGNPRQRPGPAAGPEGDGLRPQVRQDKAAADFQAWRQQLLQNMNDHYVWGGDMVIQRVVDDRVQTFVSMPKASDLAVIEFQDKAGKPDKVNYELENGCYVINKVLRPGEKWHLILGKEQAWIKVK